MLPDWAGFIARVRLRHNVLVPVSSLASRRRIQQACALSALTVALAIPLVVLPLRGLGDAASVAQLVSLPIAIVSLVVALPTWVRRADSPSYGQVPTTVKKVKLLSRETRHERRPWLVPLIVLASLVAIAEIGTFVLYTVGEFTPSSVNRNSSSQEHTCRHPENLPGVAEGNRSETEARNFLVSNGFLNVTTEAAFVSGAPKGVVVGQTPPPGTILCPRDLVTIKVTR
jgi:hypothetical protein